MKNWAYRRKRKQQLVTVDKLMWVKT